MDACYWEFEKQHPKYDIEPETVAGSWAAVYPDVLRTSMASGDPADVFFMWGGSIAQPFINADQVRELSADYEKFGWITVAENQAQYPATFAGSATIGVTLDCSVQPFGCKWADILSSDRGTYSPTDQAFSKSLIASSFEAQDLVVAGRMTPEDAAALIQKRIEEAK